MPLHEEIYQQLLNQINTGEYLPGDKIPGEIELCSQFSVSRQPIRQAVLRLVSEGYLQRKRRAGTFVTIPKLENKSIQFIASYHEEMAKKGLHPKTQVMQQKILRNDEVLCRKLEIPLDSKIFALTRLRIIPEGNRDIPQVLTSVYLPYDKYSFLLEYDFEEIPLYEALKEHRVFVSDVVREMEIRLLTARQSKFLDAGVHSPAHFITSCGRNQDGEMVEYAESYYPADRNKFIIRIHREE